MESEAFVRFQKAINAPEPDFLVPLGPAQSEHPTNPVKTFLTTAAGKNDNIRKWESPLAGHAYDLQGPDAAAVGMAPAPKLGSDELAAEMAEVYSIAILRDVPFEAIRKGLNDADKVATAIGNLAWFADDSDPLDVNDEPLSQQAKHRHSVQKQLNRPLTPDTLFRGSTKGNCGPYISQFMLQGNRARSNTKTDEALQLKRSQVVQEYKDNGEKIVRAASPADGQITYGAQRIDQRIDAHKRGTDYIQDWASWLDVQNGAATNNQDQYETDHLRFITTPRDLATFVHFDALYQAYLNACLLLLANGASADKGFPEAEGEHATRVGFATFGGPHILTLVTETATRSLKAVRRQKYNHHCRARPEVLATVATLAASTEHSDKLGSARHEAKQHLEKLLGATDGNGFSILGRIHEMNRSATPSTQTNHGIELPDISNANYLLPMAFPEGSPMHPAYGAGHATVAGSCVTVLKAFFEMFNSKESWTEIPMSDVNMPDVLIPDPDGLELVDANSGSALTVQGELNKLAANVAIGRNMAGVHGGTLLHRLL